MLGWLQVFFSNPNTPSTRGWLAYAHWCFCVCWTEIFWYCLYLPLSFLYFASGNSLRLALMSFWHISIILFYFFWALSYFLALQDISNSLPALVLERVISPRSSVPFRGKWYLETEIHILSVIIPWDILALLGHFSR